MTELDDVTRFRLNARAAELGVPNRKPRPAGVLDLSRNELVHPRLPELVGKLLDEAPSEAATKYPIYSDLIVELARVLRCEPESLEIFPGSDDAIGVLIDAFAAQTGSLLLQDPTYPTYRYHAQLRGVTVLPWLPRPATYQYDPEDAVRAMEATPPTVTVLTEPHGMLGHSLGGDTLQTLAASAAVSGHLLVVDECYAAFGTDSPAAAFADHEQLIRIGSFSKTAGLAGLRLGYLIGAPPVVDYVRRWRRAAAVSGISAWVALRLCRDHADDLATIRAEVADGREWLASEVMALDSELTPLRSEANFLTIDAGDPYRADRLVTHLASHGVVVRSHAGQARFSSLIQCTAATRAVLQQVVTGLATALPASELQ